MASISDELKRFISTANTLTKLIVINVVVFVIVQIIMTIYSLYRSEIMFEPILQLFMVPSWTHTLIRQPWSIFTYMFLHQDIMHILFNMLWFYVFGKIFLEYRGGKKLTTVYILGGISGAILYVLAFNIFPAFQNIVEGSHALGASASIMAIVVATAVMVPDYPLNLILLGRIPLKYIAIFSVILDVINIRSGNAGGHIAHLGGVIFGGIYMWQFKSGVDIGKWFENLVQSVANLLKPKPRMRTAYNANKRRPISDEEFVSSKKAFQEEIDRILDKIAKSGYDSLTKDEKDKLFRASGKK